ncbi:uncharacterized protein [Nothobranchius furzeri]|uniref:uncharacterized protein isoform X1 n=1 Tax=Nothobranchius furzeri TaxID=105023 RepID=UPI003904C974
MSWVKRLPQVMTPPHNSLSLLSQMWSWREHTAAVDSAFASVKKTHTRRMIAQFWISVCHLQTPTATHSGTHTYRPRLLFSSSLHSPSPPHQDPLSPWTSAPSLSPPSLSQQRCHSSKPNPTGLIQCSLIPSLSSALIWSRFKSTFCFYNASVSVVDTACLVSEPFPRTCQKENGNSIFPPTTTLLR